MVSPGNLKISLPFDPILRESVLSGSPVSRGENLVRSRDWTSTLVLWECSEGCFRWKYAQDEVVVVISGEAYFEDGNGEERRFAAGDIGFFPAGTSCTWRVTQPFRKVALVRETMWPPLGFCVKAWKKMLRFLRLAPQSPLAVAFAAGACTLAGAAAPWFDAIYCICLPA